MRERLDKLLVERGFLKSREKAQAYIMGGSVRVGGEVVYRASLKVPVDSDIQINFKGRTYVSRGGVKLEKALKDFVIDVEGKVCLDIGASTGGFTDCLLKMGAKKVIAVDVGKNQLDYSLRIDPGVEIVEGFNARYIDQLEMETKPDIVTMDVSFISIKLILKPLASLLNPNSSVIVLIKPQFEIERAMQGFKGVVMDSKLHVEILKKLSNFFKSSGYLDVEYTFSPLKGPKGNIEFFVHLKPGYSKIEHRIEENKEILEHLVKRAHNFFKKRADLE